MIPQKTLADITKIADQLERIANILEKINEPVVEMIMTPPTLEPESL